MEGDAPIFPAEKKTFYREDEDVRYLRNAVYIYHIIWRSTPEDNNLKLIKPSKMLQKF
jgi:hypothetical protein